MPNIGLGVTDLDKLEDETNLKGGARRRGVRASRGPSLQVPMLLLLETAPLDYLVHYLPGAPPERAAPPLCRGRPARGLGVLALL